MLRLAKHLVKCFYCSETFDANEEDFIKVNARRYAHRRCAEKQEFEKTLIYWFEVKGESLEKANDGIGIVEWVWDRAYDYWYKIYLLQEVNADKEIEKMYKIKNSVTNKSPKVEKKIKLFDIEGESNGQ